MDTKAFYKLSYGLYVVSSEFNGKRSGCVVNTLAQVTATSAKLSVAINKNNFTAKTILQSKKFVGVSLLQNVSMDIIGEFGFKCSETEDKFATVKTLTDSSGIPYLAEGVAARFSCDVVDSLDLGTHIMFIGEVKEAEVISSEEVLTYSYYQTVKKGGTPKSAPSYKELEHEEKRGYVCSVCGYHLESDVLPADFICPICKQGADKFVKL